MFTMRMKCVTCYIQEVKANMKTCPQRWVTMLTAKRQILMKMIKVHVFTFGLTLNLCPLVSSADNLNWSFSELFYLFFFIPPPPPPHPPVPKSEKKIPVNQLLIDSGLSSHGDVNSVYGLFVQPCL